MTAVKIKTTKRLQNNTFSYSSFSLIEVNGKIVLTKTREDLARLLSAAPDPAQIVVLRRNSINNGIARNCTQQQSASAAAASTTNNAVREVASLRSELEVVRERAEEAQRAKDGLRSDNIRLTHRISYLEEQVSLELRFFFQSFFVSILLLGF